jgi:hypothetical protein
VGDIPGQAAGDARVIAAASGQRAWNKAAWNKAAWNKAAWNKAAWNQAA